MKKPYYIGLDCGTNSVGWAVTDEKYRLIRGNGKDEIGAHLFTVADTAADRRIARSNRRRNNRAKTRLKLLRKLFRDEMVKIDPDFYQRLHESFYYEEDKNLQKKSKNTLFNDSNFTDKDYYKKYPTIWHLRSAIIHADSNEHFDLRLYFLAIQHILKHRGHFLFEGSFSQNSSGFLSVYQEFVDTAANYDYILNDSAAEKVEKIICDKKSGKQDKKKALKELLWTDETDEDSNNPKDLVSLAGLLVGSVVDLAKIFDIEESYKLSFGNVNFEEKESEIETAIGADNMDLIYAAKRIYDFGILHNLLGKHEYISDAMVDNYEQHRKDLNELKMIFKPHADIYRKLFREAKFDSKFASYAAYIGEAYSEKGDRRKTERVSQEDFNKHLKKLLEQVGYTGSLLERAEQGELLPKQRGQAKGTIPQQIHHQELELILKKLGQDFPSFAEEDPREKSDYKTKIQKIAKIHDFRVPYYCGPLVKRKYDGQGKPVVGGKSTFSWADQEINEIVYPWNFDDLVDKDTRADNFIRRMTNECTYLVGEKVLPKASLSYQRYMVLNELNNLKLDGQRIENDLKQKIFEEGYIAGTLNGNITLKRLDKWLKENFPETRDMELGGTSESKFLPKLSTYRDFHKILGKDFYRKYSMKQLDDVVEAITVLNEEKVMLRNKIAKILKLEPDSGQAQQLARLSYKGWGKFSDKFLNGIYARIEDKEMTILDALWETNHNLMELLGSDYGFTEKKEEINAGNSSNSQTITYRDVDALYCSPAVKRAVWRTIKIVNDIVRVNGTKPAKIFIEVTREDKRKTKKGYKLSRKSDLENKFKAIHTPEAKAILKELDNYGDRDLQQKKLFLYFSQMGKCAYCGQPIDIEELNNTKLYDIDHIFPRSLTKDDSITRNLVLVHAKENREKTNVYPISGDIRTKMHGTWMNWCSKELITGEKYKRLVRANPLTADELGGFIARQIVETSQTVKAIRDLLKRAYPETKVVMVKAGQVSDFRRLMGYDQKDKEGNVKRKGRPEFVKVRELNDFHHAKDAYLNIVVGNVMNSTFTDDPRRWVKERNNQQYTINPQRIFREAEEYETWRGDEKVKTKWPSVQSWDFAESIEIVSKVMQQSDNILWTRMNYIESSELSDLQLVGKSEKTDGIMPIKQNKRLDPKKYGGYNSIKGAHFALIEQKTKKDELERKIVAIPQTVSQGIRQKSPEHLARISRYIAKEYENAKVIIPVIKYKEKFEINGVPLHLTGRTGNRLAFQHGLQLTLSKQINPILKRIISVVNKDRITQGKYEIDEEKDGVNLDVVLQVYDALLSKASTYEPIPGLEAPMQKFGDSSDNFRGMNIKEQCKNIIELLKVFSCSAERANLSGFIPKASQVGLITLNNNINNCHSAFLIQQSPSGLYEKRINLKTVKPKR